jgi:hypothetical protein
MDLIAADSENRTKYKNITCERNAQFQVLQPAVHVEVLILGELYVALQMYYRDNAKNSAKYI